MSETTPTPVAECDVCGKTHRTGSAVAEKHAAAARQAAAVKRDATEPADKPAETYTDEEGRTFTRRNASDVWQLVPADKPAAVILTAESPEFAEAVDAVEPTGLTVRMPHVFPFGPADESSLIAQGYSRARVLVLTGQA